MTGGIRGRRLALALKQAALASAARISTSELSKIERGFSHPSPETYQRLASCLGTTAPELRTAHEAYVQQAIPGEGYTTVPAADAAILDRQIEPPTTKWRVLDLFCGCGGLSYGFEQSGQFVVSAGVDLLSDRIETFRANHPHAVSIIGDLREFSAHELNRLSGLPDIIVGGPPCQGFSSIRPFRTLTEGDPRNTLVEEFVLAVASIQPKWFLFENVVGLLTHEGGKAFDALLRGLAEAGYFLDWRVINMALLGLPQARERLIVVGSQKRETFPWPTVTHFYEYRSMAGRAAKRLHVEPLFARQLLPAVTVMDAIGDLPPVSAGEGAYHYQEGYHASDYAKSLRNGTTDLTLHEATAHSEKMLEIIRRAGTNRSALPDGMTTSGFSSCYSRLEGDRPSVTLTVNFVHPASNRCIHPFQDRALTPREGARLQSFPDNFVFSGTRAQIVKQIGNAVPPLLGRALADRLFTILGPKVQSPDRHSSEVKHIEPVSAARQDIMEGNSRPHANF